MYIVYIQVYLPQLQSQCEPCLVHLFLNRHCLFEEKPTVILYSPGYLIVMTASTGDYDSA